MKKGGRSGTRKGASAASLQPSLGGGQAEQDDLRGFFLPRGGFLCRPHSAQLTAD